jgi:hypothetical protein
MSSYIKLSTLEYPLFEGDIRVEHSEITDEQTGDTFPCPPTYAKVQYVAPYRFNPETHICYETAPESRDGGWYMTWGVRELRIDEKIHNAKNLPTQENIAIANDLEIAKQGLDHPSYTPEQKVLWQQFIDATEEYTNTFPRSGIRPRMPAGLFPPRPDQDLTAPGSAPNVID